MDPGFRLAVPDHELTDTYLAGEIAARPVDSAFINHGDVYSAVPDKLVSGRRCVRDRDGIEACYIISPVRFAGKNMTRKLRTIDGDPNKSFWHSEKGKLQLEGSKFGGYVQDFVQAVKTDGRTERTGWRMKEYGLSTEHGDSGLVLCKVYRTPRNPSTASTSTTPAMPVEDVPAYSRPAILISKKRNATDGYPEDSRPSARRRLAEEHPTTADPAARTQPESAVDEALRMYFAVPYDERIKAAFPVALDPIEMNASSRQMKEAQPEPEMDDSFVQSMEQEFPFLYHTNSNNGAVIEEDASHATPWPPAAQSEEENATGLVQTITADDQMDAILGEEGAQPEPQWDMEQEFPFLYPRNNNDDVVTEEAATPWPRAAQPEEDAATGLMATFAADDQMDAILGEEGAHPEPEPAPDGVIYGLPCPEFSPEMIRRCSMTPWPSPSSMAMIFGGLC